VTISTQSHELAKPRVVPLAPTEGISWERVPVVADAPVLIGDCLRYAKLGREPLLPLLTHRPPVVNLYATERVRAEVEEHLPAAARNCRLSQESVARIWREQIAPLVNFVPLAALPPRDARVARLAQIDPDDAPTGSLAELLGPCLVFSSDSHLRDVGIARNDWGNLMANAREVGIYQAGTSGTMIAAVLVIGSCIELGAGIVGAARRYPLPTVVLAAAGAYALYAYVRSDRGVAHRVEARAIAAEAADRVMEFVVRATECEAMLERAAFVPEGEPTQLARVARVVATAPHPVRASAVAQRLGLSTQNAAAVLRHPIFIRTADAHYVVGCRQLGSRNEVSAAEPV